MAAVSFDEIINHLKGEGHSDDEILEFFSRFFRVITLPSDFGKSPDFRKTADEKIQTVRILEMFGISKAVKGYKYLIDAISIYRKGEFNSIVGIYEKVGEINGPDATASRVERAIRSAIHRAWEKADYSTLSSLFGETVAKNNETPNNSEVIATLAERLEMGYSSVEIVETVNQFDELTDNLKAEGYTSNDILDEINDMFWCGGNNVQVTKKETDEKQNTIRLLEKLGVQKNIKGYKYLIEAISLYKNDPNQSLTKELYPAVAEKFATTSSRVERAIRHAIENGCYRCSARDMREIFGNIRANCVPTNGEAIATLAEKLEYM